MWNKKMDLLIGTGLLCAVTLAFTGIALWVRRPEATGLAASSTFHSGLAIAAVALWAAGLGLVGRGLATDDGLVGPHTVGAVALVVLTFALLKTLHPFRRFAAYDTFAPIQLALVSDPSGQTTVPAKVASTSHATARKAA